MLEEIRNIAALIHSQPANARPTLEGGLSTAFGCTYEGVVPAEKVVALADQLCEAGCDEIGLADSVGYANPAQVRDLVVRVRARIGKQRFAGLHLHNTRGLGLANVVAGLEVGVETFDSSMAGIGGCPFAPGATGNIVTEDLVFMLEAMGLGTGIDLSKLLRAREILTAAVPNEELYGYLPAAGLPLGYRARTAGVSG
jgi:hydroxymethylglutaryl-CoA lyase